jgi:hypothetical protein
VEYRIYFLDTSEHIESVFAIDCETDAEALEIAKVRAAGRSMELWCRDRMMIQKLETVC